MKGTLEDTINGEHELTIRTELQGGVGKYGRLLGWLYVGDDLGDDATNISGISSVTATSLFGNLTGNVTGNADLLQLQQI